MKITVKLVGGFVHTVGFSEKELELPPGATAGALLATIGIEPSRPSIVARNGWMITPDEEIRAGDRVVVSPIFSGG